MCNIGRILGVMCKKPSGSDFLDLYTSGSLQGTSQFWKLDRIYPCKSNFKLIPINISIGHTGFCAALKTIMQDTRKTKFSHTEFDLTQNDNMYPQIKQKIKCRPAILDMQKLESQPSGSTYLVV